MPSFDQDLLRRIEQDQNELLSRALTIVPEHIVPFSGNDYLGLSIHPHITEAAISSLQKGRMGASAARLVSGNCPEHNALEQKLAEFKNCEASLIFPSGYAAACGTIPAVVDRSDYVVLDKFCHACLFDGARLSGATITVFPHNDTDYLASVLQEIRSRQASARILVIVKSVYSMDGDIAPLPEICELKERFDAWLMVDEAHASGIYGPHGAGLCAENGISKRVEIQMMTLGKAFGVSGGAICGSQKLHQHLLQHARPFIFTTGTPPCLAAAALAALEIVAGSEGDALRQKLWSHVRYLHSLTNKKTNLQSPIIPAVLGSEEKTLEASHALFEAGFYVPAIRYPSVPRGRARLRITLSAQHSHDQIEGLSRQLPAFLSA